MFKQSLAMLSGSWFSRWIQNLKISIVICKLRDNLPSSFLDATFVERFLNLNTSYKNVYAFSQWSLLYLLPCLPFRRQSVTSAPPSWRDSLAQIQERSSSSGTCCCAWKSTSVKQNERKNFVFRCGMHVETLPVQMTDFQLPAEVVVTWRKGRHIWSGNTVYSASISWWRHSSQ